MRSSPSPPRTLVLAAPAAHPVGASAGEQAIVRAATGDSVRTTAAANLVLVVGSAEDVVPRPALDQVRAPARAGNLGAGEPAPVPGLVAIEHRKVSGVAELRLAEALGDRLARLLVG